MIKVGAWGFWDGFNREDHFFLHMMKFLYGESEVIAHNHFDCDVAFIAENYLPKEIDSSKTRVVSFMAEPKPVDYENKDIHAYLSFDPTNHLKNNTRLPLWFLYVNFFDIKNQDNPFLVVDENTLYRNKWAAKQKIKFCAAPYSNIVSPRPEFHSMLNSYRQTDGFGLPHRNGDADRNEFKKYDFVSDYKFCMSFENTLKLGYVTEKLLQAKTAGCIPLYWGSEYANHDFNPECFIHINGGGYKSVDECMEYIKHIDQNDTIYNKMKTEPLFTYNIRERLETITKRFGEQLHV